ncbi:unnamed protein product [Nezara viridula]|uniref:Uncharacterized protein n=1 Tax=Nezara viridula TaxID=85310 RepID=A0A9P0MTG7_NEZVI|nr:unnamed protein product [Nezara viridula]
MTSPRASEDEEEINVDSGHEDGTEDEEQPVPLPFSISRLLGEERPAGVIRVPAQRAPPPPVGPFPWGLVHPAAYSSAAAAAAAAFASHAIKERLTGQSLVHLK